MLQHLLPPSTQMLMGQQGGLLAVSDTEVRVGIVAQWHGTMKPKIVNLEAAFAKVLGYPVTVRLDVATPADFQAARQSTTPLPNAVSPPAIATDSRPIVDNPPITGSPITDNRPRSPAPPQSSVPPSSGPAPAPLSSLPAPAPSSPHPPFQLAPTPPPGSQPVEDWVEHDVTRAAKQLAEFFGGKVIDISDDETSWTSGMPVVGGEDLPDELTDYDDDDMPF